MSPLVPETAGHTFSLFSSFMETALHVLVVADEPLHFPVWAAAVLL